MWNQCFAESKGNDSFMSYEELKVDEWMFNRILTMTKTDDNNKDEVPPSCSNNNENALSLL